MFLDQSPQRYQDFDLFVSISIVWTLLAQYFQFITNIRSIFDSLIRNHKQ